MTGWILFATVVSLIIGIAVGFGIGVYFSAKGIAKMVENGEITYNSLQTASLKKAIESRFRYVFSIDRPLKV